MRSVWMPGGGALLVSACTLVTSLDDLSGGQRDAGLTRDPMSPDDAGESPLDGDVVNSKYRDAVMADQPVGYWRLGEKTGTVAKDEVGAHDGTYVGGVTLGASPTAFSDTDTAVSLDGKSGQIVIGNVFGFTSNAPFSVETWVNIPTIDGSLHYVVAKQAEDAGSGWFVAQNKLADGLGFGVMNKGLWSHWTAPILPDTWVHQVGTFTATRLCLYLNSYQVNCFEPGNAPAGNSQPLVFGASSDGAGYFKGVLDEIAIYDHELTAERVKAHYAARH